MADSSRVEELRKRYHENPRRFFAPLANEYRKGGFLDRAILLCQKHLGEQPGNMNGLIVYGQTLFESGRHEEARGPFESALELDPENLIALRHLGDIARLAGDNAAAQRWYGRVLEYDRRNDEVQALLDQVGGAADQPSAPPPAAAGRPSVSPTIELLGDDVEAREEIAPATLASAKTLEVTPRKLATPPRPVAPRVPTPVRSATPAKGMRRASLLDIDFDFGELTSQADARDTRPRTPPAPLMGAEAAEYGFSPTADLPLLEPMTDERPEPMGDVAPIDGLEAADFDADVAPLDDLESSEFDSGPDVIAPLPELETAEFQVPDAGEPLGALPGLDELDPEQEFEVPVATPLGDSVPFLDEPAIESAAAEPAILTPESMPVIDTESFGLPTPASTPAIVTETMAELYLEQGHRAEAMEVYRKLLAHDPSDPALQAKLASLQAAESERHSLEFDVPSDAAEDPAERAPENAMLAEVSFEDLDLSTPAAAADAPSGFAAPAAPAVPFRATPSGPSAREFFAAFAQRTLAAGSAAPAEVVTPPSGSWAVPAAISSLDDLFGVEVKDDDQRAANYLAGVGTTSAPSGTSSFDRLFATDDPAPAPRHSVPRASEKLRFDQFFSSTSTPPASASAPVADAEPATPAEPEGAAGAPGDGDDLDQFQGWLKGLTQ